MKYLLVLLLVLLGVWMWRSSRPRKSNSKKPSSPNSPQDMVSCVHCGLHIPQAESVQGRQGVYCNAAHLEQAER